ncbi:MAG: ImmA/IrrE family metallo-endopeptidase [Bryobacterales bacterium]|nr:ImmA/IrrE family metallo-endopeptidase [Bryobacterales bacterium]
MIRNGFLSPKTAADIERRVDSLLRGLGDTRPPLNLYRVRKYLSLELGSYPDDHLGAMRSTVSRIRISTLRSYRRPALVAEAIRKYDLSALYLPERRRILLDPSLPGKKRRWNVAHEIGHRLIPWHDDPAFGDNRHTLSPECHRQIEVEANFAAGRILFLGKRFDDEARSFQPSIESVLELHRRFGNTITTTLYRLVELPAATRPMVGMITRPPGERPETGGADRPTRREHFIRSIAFKRRFANVREEDLFEGIAGYCDGRWVGLVGESELVLADDNRDLHRFFFQTFFNGYDALTLGVHVGPAPATVFVRPAMASKGRLGRDYGGTRQLAVHQGRPS